MAKGKIAEVQSDRAKYELQDAAASVRSLASRIANDGLAIDKVRDYIDRESDVARRIMEALGSSGSTPRKISRKQRRKVVRR